MPIDLWKEVFMKDNPEPSHVQLFIKMLLAGVEATLDEASRKVRYEAIPDAIVAWRDPVPLVAIASLYYVGLGDRSLKIIAVEPMPGIMEQVVSSIAAAISASVYPVRYNIGYGKERVSEGLQKAIRVVRGAAPRVVDVSDAPGALAIALHRAGVRTYTVVRRKGYEVLIEKFNL